MEASRRHFIPGMNDLGVRRPIWQTEGLHVAINTAYEYEHPVYSVGARATIFFSYGGFIKQVIQMNTIKNSGEVANGRMLETI